MIWQKSGIGRTQDYSLLGDKAGPISSNPVSREFECDLYCLDSSPTGQHGSGICSRSVSANKRAHTELSAALPEQAKRALRHFCKKGCEIDQPATSGPPVSWNY